mmetsp:Transcript_2259/g.3975  ORF Transcript_2259/g.3975 Transcript_2259/m.3975 type:complete len:121 (-) Transcript_2259:82-444(-)
MKVSKLACSLIAVGRLSSVDESLLLEFDDFEVWSERVYEVKNQMKMRQLVGCLWTLSKMNDRFEMSNKTSETLLKIYAEIESRNRKKEDFNKKMMHDLNVRYSNTYNQMQSELKSTFFSK